MLVLVAYLKPMPRRSMLAAGGGAQTVVRLCCHGRPPLRDRLPAALRDPSPACPRLPPLHRLYRTLLNFEASLGCIIANGTAWEPPPGWELAAMLNVTEAASNTAGAPAGAAPGTVVLPFAALLLNRASGQLVVAVRGTQTAAEWAVDFSYNQTSGIEALGGAPVHSGFAGIFQQLWPGVEAALEQLMAGPSPAAKEVGGGMAGWGAAGAGWAAAALPPRGPSAAPPHAPPCNTFCRRSLSLATPWGPASARCWRTRRRAGWASAWARLRPP